MSRRAFTFVQEDPEVTTPASRPRRNVSVPPGHWQQTPAQEKRPTSSKSAAATAEKPKATAEKPTETAEKPAATAEKPAKTSDEGQI